LFSASSSASAASASGESWRKKTSLLVEFSLYVCPEPVLANTSSVLNSLKMAKHHKKQTFFPDSPPAPARGHRPRNASSDRPPSAKPRP
jgi:hypothetical protein